MSYRVYCTEFSSTDLTNGNLSASIVMNKNYLIRYVRTSVVILNSAPFTNLRMKIYTDDGYGSKSSLLYTSTNSYTTAQITTSSHAVRNIYFTFDDVPVNSGRYHFVLTASPTGGYTDPALMYWQSSYPYPEHQGGFALIHQNLPKFPYKICLIGAEF